MRILTCLAVLAFLSVSGRAADLTPLEQRWLQTGWPVIAYAKQQGLPLDVVVEPRARPGDAPVATGYVDGRCKLVLAMRGNPQAQASLDRLAPDLLQPAVEAMMAHEIGHCWRYVHGAWHSLPAGFSDPVDDAAALPDAALEKLRRDMHATRREEGFADLVGLAWTRWKHPERYAQVQAWLASERADQPVPGAHHDTRAWLRLARDPQVFAAGATPFEAALVVWLRGLTLPAGDPSADAS